VHAAGKSQQATLSFTDARASAFGGVRGEERQKLRLFLSPLPSPAVARARRSFFVREDN
jgi:hypothetical protein